MSICFDTVADIVRAQPPLSNILQHADRYWAHIHPVHAPERFEEHYDRVNRYFVQICEKNGLDRVIDALIEDYVMAYFPRHTSGEIAGLIKKLFVRTVIYHDFGKVNENFQADPKKMNNRNFSMTKGSPIAGNHSKLGAYLYVTQHFNEMQQWPLEDETAEYRMRYIILAFSYSIIKHHAGFWNKPDHTTIQFGAEELDFMLQYLDKYGIVFSPEIQQLVSAKALKLLFDFIPEIRTEQGIFSFFALMRLNFSMLTASDYLATGQYSYDLHLTKAHEWGIWDTERRNEIIRAARHNAQKDYNTQAYTLWEDYAKGRASLTHPTQRGGAQLNQLRTEMAVEVLQQLSQHHDKRLFYLEAPTGGGKTNISMLAVAELLKFNPEINKVFYVFPFTTLITQTHKAIIDTLLLTEDDIALLHGKSGFQTISRDKPEIEEAEDGLYGNHRKDFLQNLFALYPVALVTHVRFFDILKSKGKDNIYLLHRLANSIVILDELQSYTPKHWDKMLFLLDQYGKFFNIRFILMSATLPRLDRIEAVSKASGQLPDFIDLLPNALRYFQNDNFKGRVSFNFELLERGQITGEELATFVLEQSQKRAKAHNGRVFTIVEFIYKRSATEFKQIMEQLNVEDTFFDDIFVLSGTILESRRREIINELKLRQKATQWKVLLITTQVVEAGVDIDMDLGFKNISLIDSDEQLAGRVNRNVNKDNCEVYLFNQDDASVLYRSDYRYKITRELDADFHRTILSEKNFSKLYDKVFQLIEQRNRSTAVENFSDEYLDYIAALNYAKADEQFRIIEQQTLSVFVPLELPIEIMSEKGSPEPFFSQFELDFLRKSNVWHPSQSVVRGDQVWSLYRKILTHPNDDFIAKKIEQKVLQGILAKFTFSLFASEKNRQRLAENSHAEQNIEDYFYLSNWNNDNLYSIESGLNEALMDSNTII